VVRSDQFSKGLLVHADVLNLKWDPFLRKVGLSPCTWRSTGSTEHDDFLLHPLSSKSDLTARAAAGALRRANFFYRFCAANSDSTAPARWISEVIRAVDFSMAETEQYFSSDSLTASSTAFRVTAPETV
jgi:hypothetical protein